MFTDRVHGTDFLPILSRGKHRSPRKGACFMEFASYLAGERWSDHPSCTNPLLAELARQVNDHSSEHGRQKLVALVPEVIGLTGSDLRVDIQIALRAAQAALPIASEEWQRVMAVAVLSCERLLADLDNRSGAPLSEHSGAALALAPGAAAWAERYGRNAGMSRRVFRRQTAPAIVSYAVRGIAQASVPDPDRILRELLMGAIEDCRRGDGTRATLGPDDQRVTTTSRSAAEAASISSAQITA